jgi:hypothetical protein
MNFNELTVREISREECKPYILGIHYAKRFPIIQYAYGCYLGEELLGIITFGSSPNRNSNTLGKYKVLELNRLCMKKPIKNLPSYLIAASLRLLPSPCVLISYADSTWNHHGYVYQATNWVYTGESAGQYEFEIGGKKYHKKSIFNKFGTSAMKVLEGVFGIGNVKVNKLGSKHRYFQFVGNKTDKKEMKKLLQERYKELPYPKGDNKNYETSKTQE